MKSFKDLEVWKLSIDFVEDVYKLTNAFPGNEKFGLVPQMRRAAVSISSNIALMFILTKSLYYHPIICLSAIGLTLKTYCLQVKTS